MGFILKLLGGTLGPYIAGAIGALLLVSMGTASVQTLRLHHAKAAEASWHKKADDARAVAASWGVSFHQSEALRTSETAASRAALAEAGKSCDARVAKARASATAIHSIITKEPKYDAAHCPVRALADPNQLRDAIDPAG